MASNRAGKIEDHLLAEGQKAKAKQEQRELEEKNKQKAKNKNITSEKYIIQKFTREFDAVVDQIFSAEEDETEQNHDNEYQ